MTPKQYDTARAMAACKGCRWLPGMAARYIDGGDSHRVLAVSDRLTGINGVGLLLDIDGTRQAKYPADYVPDLDDAVTVAALICVVRKAHGDPSMAAVFFNGRWAVVRGLILSALSVTPWTGDTEPAALLAALQAAS